MKRIFFLLVVCTLALMLLCSCGGENADQGSDALSVEYVYSLAKAGGYEGTLEEFIEEFKGDRGNDGVGIESASISEDSHLILTLSNGKTVDCGKISVDMFSSSSISIGENGNWYINGEDTGKRAEAENVSEWHTGSGAPSSDLGDDGDFYLNVKNNDLYKKVDGVWSVIAKFSGNGITDNEGSDSTINPGDNHSVYAASKALLSAVKVQSNFASASSSTPKYSNGAGVIYKLDKEKGDAYIITNYHVVYGKTSSGTYKIAPDISVYIYGMEHSDYKITAEFLGGSMNYDIAVLKVKDCDLFRNVQVEAVSVGNSAAVNVLDTAIAVGNPSSAGISVTKGSVSVLSEEIELTGPDDKTKISYRVMRIDTPVNSGNSGGGLFNSKGELIGIVSAKEMGSGIDNIGYAIPSNLAVAVAENVIRNCDGKTNTSVIKCVIGMSISIGEITREYDPETGVIKIKNTCIVYEINSGSIAENVLMVNDVLKSFEIDGKTYAIDHTYDGAEALLYSSPSSEIYVNFERDGVDMRVRLYTTSANFSKIG